MTFTSYARNFEDLLLWRALRDVPHGFYIDVGAGEPRRDSATHAFYERGWRGINIEPAPGMQRRLAIERPADVNLPCGAGAAPATLPFFEEADGLGSTFDPDQAQRLSVAGHVVLQREAPVRTLAAICAEQAVGAIHFLRIATGGAEAQVLAGFDLARWRPWIVVVEGDAGREDLLAAGYRFAYTDARNCYYVAPEQAHLAATLAVPPHPADDFVLCEGHPYSQPLDEWRRRTAAAEAAADEARNWAMAHVKEWKDKHYLSNENAQKARRAEAELAALTARLAEANARLTDLTNRARQADEMDATLAAVYASLSWKVTRPLRGARNVARAAVRIGRRTAQAARTGAIRVAKGLLGRAIRFVVSRPALAFFLRRQIARFPGLVPRARAILMRSRHTTAAPGGGATATDLTHVPDAARRVFADLSRPRRQPPHS
ncbi:FkbM family methyltransferase [Pseudoduganella flava]|uniref:FkbM family methyltransferase n=1 Tax=Pseudoduganella flava TaxID=871742 RepID=A0A562PW76_9BURK|nr:FkbM family methyltransferase [Pseudoduganella flava]QGZ39527.1 hypothetical protein GO485_11035 [Pseudoduganella flava]TWI48420.1 FkbM family methyltransferase [Pseudoduganella flava]